jgi:uncharacterized protein
VSVASIALRREVSLRVVLTTFALGAVVALAGRAVGIGEAAELGTFTLIFTSIVVEALPFVLLGALVSAMIEVFVRDSVFTRLGRLPLAMQIPGAALGGLAFPVCECGSVPVARRLILKGLHPAAGLSFMLASPILNPIVLWSTYIAYKGRGFGWQMLTGRAIGGLILAIVVGWVIGSERAAGILRAKGDVSDHDHGESRGLAFLDHLAHDFTFMARFVVIGGALAAALQTLVPQGVIGSVAGNPVVASIALMGLAYLLSLCSEADAFVAVSFTQFPLSAQLSFLVFGPVVDAKLSFLYGATFRGSFVIRLIVVSIPVVLATALWFESVVR